MSTLVIYCRVSDILYVVQVQKQVKSILSAVWKMVGRISMWGIIGFILYTTRKLSFASLLPTSHLNSSCYSFPIADYGYFNNIKYQFGTSPFIHLTKGLTAIDFSLSDPHGKEYTLSTLLHTKPVLMVWGHYTCPAYHNYKADSFYSNCGYMYENDLADRYHDKVHFLHIISAEPHPMFPHANFDHGLVRMNFWSTYGQPQTYKERLINSVAKVQELTSNHITILVDKLDGPKGRYNNPVWCSYANGAR